MAFPPKSSVSAFAKKAATPPPAASLLAKKRAMAAQPPPAVPAAPPAPPMPAPAAPAMARPPAPMMPGMPEGDGTPVNLFELVEEAAQAAEGQADPDIEDAIAGSDSQGPDDPPEFAQDPEKWAEAAEAVGLGVPGTEDKYDEPFAVTVYLYAMIGGAMAPAEGAEPPPEEKAPEESDMSKPGTAAKAIQARAAARGG
jgi:hypothetical protein